MRDSNPLTTEALLAHAELSPKEVADAGLSPIELLKIFRHHRDETNDLDSIARFVVDTLRRAEGVHSTRYRVKDPYHLVRKIVRKAAQSGHRRRSASLATYRNTITDLVGVRAIHLFKHQWLPIHEFITSTWKLHEKPVANMRHGDDPELTDSFRKSGLRIVRHPLGYRSVHYLLSLHPVRTTHLVEVQVRTIFEEGWSEIDHQVRYPDNNDSALLGHFLGIFNRLSGSADEMGTFIHILRDQLRAQSAHVAHTLRDMQHMQGQVNALVTKLGVTEAQRAELQDNIGILLDSPRRELRTFGDAIDQLGKTWVSAKLQARRTIKKNGSKTD